MVEAREGGRPTSVTSVRGSGRKRRRILQRSETLRNRIKVFISKWGRDSDEMGEGMRRVK